MLYDEGPNVGDGNGVYADGEGFLDGFLDGCDDGPDTARGT